MKVALHSVTYLGLWYDGPGLTPLEFVRRARQFGYDGVEFDGRRPHASPLDLDPARRRAIRELCADLDLDVVALASYGDLSTPVLEQHQAALLMLREHVRLARDLGAPVVCLALAWPGVALRDGMATTEVPRRWFRRVWRDGTWLEAWNNCKLSLREAVRYAEEEGVVLALENRPPIVRDHLDVLDMIAEVDSPWLRACIDAEHSPGQDEPALRRLAEEAAAVQVHAYAGGLFEHDPEGQVVLQPERGSHPATDYPAYVRFLRQTGYDGYLSYRLARPALDRRHQFQGIEFVDRQAQLALHYLRGIVAAGAPPAGPVQGPAPEQPAVNSQ